MADNYVIMPDDSSNTGKKVRTNERSVSGQVVQEHYVILQDKDSDTQASIRDLATSNAVNVAIVDGAGDQVTSFGGGTQYTEGSTDASITGTAMLMEGAADTLLPVPGTTADGLLVNLGSNNDVTVTGTVAVTQSGTWDEVGINDSGNSITVDNSTLAVVGGGTEAAAMRVTLATDSTGVISVDDNGGSLTVDGTVAVSGTVAVTQSGTWDEVGINDSGNKITVDWNGTDPPIGGGTEATALKVTIASDSTGVLSVDDNGGSLTVDGTVTANLGTIAGVATETTLSSLLTSSQLIDDTIATLGTTTYSEATTKGAIIGAVRRDADTTLVDTTNEIGPLQMDANGRLKVEVFDGGDSHTVDGTVTANAGTGNFNVIGTKTNDNAAPGATNVGALTAIANAAAPSWTEGNLVGLSTNLAGALRVTGGGGGTEYVVNDAAPANPTGATFVMERDDQLAALAEVEGDWTNPRSTSKGALWVAIPDSNGDPITSFGGGTQYVEDDAAAANPTGTAQILVRQDTPTTLVTTDGDNVARRGTNYGAAYCQLVTSAGAYIDSVGGGTEYTEDAAAAANPLGKALNLIRTDTLSATTVDADGDNIAARAASTGAMYVEVTAGTTKLGSSTDGLLVNLGANNDVTVTGSVTANAGTNLNTSALSLEATQADVRTSVQLIDDTIATLGTTTYTETTTKGAIIGALRRDADTSAVNTDNEIAPLLVDANGYLKVEIFDGGGSHTVDGTVTANLGTIADVATETTLGSLLTSSQLIDDTVYTDDTSTHSTGVSKGIGIMAAATPTDAAVAANDIGMVAMTTDRKLHVAVMDALPAGTNGIGKLTANSGVDIGDVDVTTCGTITPGTAATNLGKAEDGAHTTGDVGVMALATANEANTVRAADNDYVPLATDTEGNLRIVGNRDHDAADAGEVVKVGGVAVSGSATPTSVASADRVRWVFNQHGIPYVIGGHPNLITREYDFGTAAQTDVNLAAAVVAADERIYVTRFEALCDNANSVAVSVRAGFGTANVPTASSSGVSGMIGSHPGIAAGSGIMCGNGAGIIAVGGAGEEPRLTSSAATSGNLHVVISYYLIDETP